MSESSVMITQNGFGRLGSTVPGLLRQVVHKTADDVLADAVRSIEEDPKTGRIYGGEQDIEFFGTGRHGMPKRVTFHSSRPEHQASAPGEAPASDTGDLANSGSVAMDPSNPRATITFATDYAEDLEMGTVHIEPRPFLKPAMDRAAGPFEQAVAAVVNAAANEVAG